MRERSWLMASAIALALCCGGCAHCKRHRSMAACEPPLECAAEGGMVVESVPAQPVGFCDRHPLLYKPRNVFHNVDHHVITKTAAAAVVGVPVGAVCEVAQIVKGCPPDCN